MFAYFRFMRELKKFEIKSINDIMKLVTEKEELNKKLIVVENEYEKKLSAAVLQKENEIFSLQHAIGLERERLEHSIKLAKEEVLHERARVLLELRGEIQKERHEFMEKNFSDLKETTSINFDRTIKSIDMFIKRLPSYHHKQLEGNGANVDIDVHEDKE